MDEKLQKALEFAKYRQTLHNQIKQVQLRAQNQLIYAKNGGAFTINRELICFFQYIISRSLSEVAILDDNNMPILITDPKAFLDEITTRYFEVTNDYYNEYQKIKKSRNVKSIVDLEV